MQKLLVAAIAVSLVIALFSLFYSSFPIVPDQLERLRQTQYILENGSQMSFDSQIAPDGSSYIYPPIADYSLAFFSSITSLDIITSMNILSFLLFLFFLFGSLLFAKKYLKEIELALMVILLSTAPIVLKRFLSFVGESFGLALFPFLFYFIQKRETKYSIAAGIVLALIALSHFRSFLTVLAAILVYAFYSIYRKKFSDAIEIAKTIIVGLILSLPWYFLNLEALSKLSSYSNPFFGFSGIDLIAFFGIPFTVAGIAFVFYSLYYKKLFKDSLLYSMLFLPLIALLPTILNFGLLFNLYREVVFLILPLSILFSKFLVEFFSSRKLFFTLAAIAGVFVFFGFVSSVFSSPFNEDFFSAGNFLQEKFPQKTVLSDYKSGYLLLYFGQKTVVGGFMESVENASERLQDSFDFFYNGNSSILQKYSVACVFDSINSQNTVYPEEFQKVFESGYVNVYCRKELLN